MTSRALVLFSGGQDSTTCLAWALNRFDIVETIGFNYGQRHGIEMECRQNILTKLPVLFSAHAHKIGPDHVLDLSILGHISETALTRETQITLQKNGLPTTFVPGRNLLFFTFAATLAYRRNITELVGGMCETDYSGYPDCRDETLQSLQRSINLGMDTYFTIHTPLMWLDKAATWNLAFDLGGDKFIQLLLDETHTCYLGERGTKHAWGYGCGTCPSCALRKKGYEAFMANKA